MKIKLFFLILYFLIFNLKTFAIEIIYPKANGANIYANSTYFVGNSNSKNNLFVNGEQIEVLENGAFLKYVPLTDGENTFFFEEKDKKTGEIKSTLDFKLNKTEAPQKCFDENEEFICSQNLFLSYTMQNYVPLRKESDENAKRLTHLGKNTILILDGKQKDFYRVQLENNNFAWVNSKHISEPLEIEGNLLTSIQEIKYGEDEKEFVFVYKLEFPVPHIIEEKDNTLTLNLYNVDVKEYSKTKNEKFTLFPLNKSVLSTEIFLNQKIFGYDLKYSNGYLIFKIKKQPQIDIEKPLNDIKIVIDAGHGGFDSGAIGPTKVKESEINLDVAKKLKKILEKQGAIVYMTREKDENVDLYERMDYVKETEPDFFISLHANALPDGANPEIKHGTAVFYYYPNAKEFAHIMQQQIIEATGTKDDGVTKRSFVVTRNSICPSILIEMAYMVHPQEYTLLLDEEFKEKMADSIKEGIKKFLLQY